MTNWPLVSDFSRMLQNPKVAFRDPALRASRIEMDNLGQPKPRSGNFATVYRGDRPDGTPFAIKVFNRKADERRERYQMVSNYLQGRSISSLVSFDYDEKGIRSASDHKLYPLLIMEWVNGVTLFEWARDRSREGYQEALASGAKAWIELVRELAAHGVVHGDLQHGNVMVSNEGYFKLVDYDGMCVPELMGSVNLELGLEPYQHPARNAETRVFLGLDNFSALLIYVALRALAVNPGLWCTFVDATGSDKLLFRKEDFENPAGSHLYYALAQSPDEEVRALSRLLFELRRWDMARLPSLDQALIRCRTLESLLAARDWDGAVQWLETLGDRQQIPAAYRPVADDAYRRVDCRHAMEEALLAHDDAELIRRYVPALMDDYPAAAHLVQQAQLARQALSAIEILKSAQLRRQWEDFKAAWQAHRHVLEDRPSAKPYQEEISRLLTIDAIGQMLQAPQSDDQAVVLAWKYLESLGGHPTAEPLRAEVERRGARHRAVAKFRALVAEAPAALSYDYDKKIAAAWQPELFKGHQPAARLLEHYKTARERLQRVRRLSQLAKQCTLEGDMEIAGSLRDLPETYHPDLMRLVNPARQRLMAYRNLQQAIKEPQTERAIVDCWRALEQAGGGPLATPADHQRVDLAVKRLILVASLEQRMKDSYPPDELDRRILEVWDESLADGFAETARWRPRYEQARERHRVAQQIKLAIAIGDLAEIDRLAAQTCFRGGLLPADVSRGIQELRERIKQTRLARKQALVQSLLENNRTGFVAAFDAQLIREICQQFPHHQPVVCRWTETDILPLSKSGLAVEPPGVERIEPATCRARWTWPQANIAERCRLLVCQKRPKPHVNPDDVESLYASTIDRAAWHADGDCHTIAIAPEWGDSVVLVWAIVDLGFQTFYSEPLEVGQLVTADQKRRWRLFG